MNTLEDYEEGEYAIPVRLHWWQFWLPKYVSGGSYTKIGTTLQLSYQGRTWVSVA